MSAGNSTNDRTVCVMAIDDHEIFRNGLERLIAVQPDMKYTGDAASCAEAVKLAKDKEPDVILLDLSLKGRSGLDVMKDIQSATPGPKFLIVSVHDENLFAERALRAGATGFVMKEEGAQHVLSGIREVAAGRFFFDESVSQKLFGTLAGISKDADRLPMDRMTDRELLIFELLGRGMSPRQIGGELNISQKTVEAHRENIKKKLDIQNAH